MANESTEVKNTVDVCGHTIKTAKDGLDIEEVTALVKRLVDERDDLAKRQENLGALTKLYEKTVIEAGEQAKQIEKEARERVQKDVGNILNQAHQRAKAMVEQQQSEAKQLIQQRLKTIRSNIKDQMESLRKQEIEKLRSTIKETAQLVFDEIAAQGKSLDGKESFEGQILEDSMFELFPVTESVKVAGNVSSPSVTKENQPASPAPARNTEALTQAGDHAPVQPAKENVPPAAEKENVTARPTGNTVVYTAGKAEPDYIEIEMLQPYSTDKIASLEKNLSNVPEIKNTGLQIVAGKNIFKVTFNRQIDLLPVLRTLPDVSHAEDTVKDGRKKIMVTLGGKEKTDVDTGTLSKKIIDAITGEA